MSMLVGVGLSPGGRLERGCTEHAGGAPAHRSLCHFWQHAHNVAVMQALDACNVYIESIKEEVEGAYTRQICLRQATYAGPAIAAAAAALPGSNISRQNLILPNFGEIQQIFGLVNLKIQISDYFGSSTSNHLRCSWRKWLEVLVA